MYVRIVCMCVCMYVCMCVCMCRAASSYLPLEFTIDGVAKTVSTTQWDAFVCVAIGNPPTHLHTYIHTYIWSASIICLPILHGKYICYLILADSSNYPTLIEPVPWRTCIHTVHTYIHTYTYIKVYIHTIHMYIHIHTYHIVANSNYTTLI